MRVWIDGWQQQCYGEDAERGGEFTAHLGPLLHTWLDDVFGEGFAAGIAGCDETHDARRATRIVVGTITRIEAATCRYEELDDGSSRPVASSGSIHEIDAVDGSYRPTYGREVVGYVVELTDAHDRP